MIDTDKYEGHIENIGRWQMFANTLPRWAEDADRKLVADAPLLLEEVKQLREAIADIANNMEAADPSYLQGFIRDLLEVIDTNAHNLKIKIETDEYIYWEYLEA